MKRISLSAPTKLLLALMPLYTACAHSVQVRTEPPGATVLVNGRELGKAPVTFEEEMSEDSQEIVARLNGYETAVVKVERSEVNPWVAIALTPLCGILGFAGAGVSLVAGGLLAIPTLGCGFLAVVPAAIMAGVGCGWTVLTSPTLLVLSQPYQLPDQVTITLKPATTFQQNDASQEEQWPPQLFWTPEDGENYWQNPPPEQDQASPPPSQSGSSRPQQSPAAF